MRSTWTDERMDDLANRVDDGFRRVDERFAQIDDRFALIDVRFAHLDDRIAGLERTMTRGFIAMASVQVACLAAILAVVAALS